MATLAKAEPRAPADSSAIDPAQFARDGFAGPIRVLRPAQCALLAEYLKRTEHVTHPIWAKGRASVDPVLAQAAAAPLLQRLLAPLLGDDIILWGCSIVRRTAGNRHPLHVDIESAAPDGRFATVWIGLENVTPDSTLHVIAGSHRCPEPVQKYRHQAGQKRGDIDSAEALGWARQSIADARLVEVPATDGEAIIFDGRLWHGAVNRLAGRERMALLLQYASGDTPVRIPALGKFDWPFAYLDEPRPPVIAISGRPDPAINQVVAAPDAGPIKTLAPLRPAIRDLHRAAPDGDPKPWQPLGMFRGRTAALDLLSCHAAILVPGHSPHPPHAHQDEELLIVLDGEADLLIADRPHYAHARPVRVKAGDFAFYPAFQHHTIRNPGDRPVRYLMFRWNRGEATPPTGRLRTSVVRDPLPAEPEPDRGFTMRRIFEGPTQWLRKLHCHSSRVEPGAGYAPHADAYDVAMIVQSGRVATLGREVGPGELIFYPAGSVHGLRNVGTEPARYLVFEFHGTRPAPAPNAADPVTG